MTDRLEFIKAAMQSLIVTSSATTLVSDSYVEKIARSAVKIADTTLALANSTAQDCSWTQANRRVDMERALDMQKGEQIGER